MEYKKKCNVCGKVFCYTDEDLRDNASDAGMGVLSALGGLASALGGGTIFHTQHLNEQANRYSEKVIDYNQCPNCHSRDLSFYNGDEKVDSPAANLPEVKTININTTASTESLMKRVFIFLEDGDWVSADAYCEACLDRDPELAAAYLGKLMAELHVGTQEELRNQEKPFDKSNNYRRAVRFADEELKNRLISFIEHINTRNEITRKDQILSEAKAKMIGKDISSYENAVALLASISGWKDADQQKSICLRKIAELKTKEEAARLERERLAEIERKKTEQEAEVARIRARKNKKFVMIITPIVVVAILAIILVSSISKRNEEEAARLEAYNSAVAMIEEGKYDDAIDAFTELGEYKDCANWLVKAKAAKQEAEIAADYANAEALRASGDYDGAIAAFTALGDYKDSVIQILETKYQQAVKWIGESKLLEAYEALLELGDYKDSKDYFSALYFIPISIDSENHFYQFSYDENMQMCYSTRTEYSISYEYSFSDGYVESVTRTGKTENESIFVWKEDGTVEEYETSSEGVEKYYDAYGNCVSVRKSSGEYLIGETTMDSSHNIVKGIHSMRPSDSTSAKNDYDDYGNLIHVRRTAGNSRTESQFSYSLCYIEDIPVDLDVIWKNIRIICGQDVWQAY